MTKVCITAVVLCALIAAPAAGAADTLLPGVDVSRFQQTIDWPKVAGDGVEFAFVQASRGSGTDCSVVPTQCGADPFYASNYLAAKAAGLRVGAYHRAFVDAVGPRTAVRSDARNEADTFTATVGGMQPGDLRPALDMETPFAGLGPKSLRLWTRTWLARVRRALGKKPLIYTNVASWTALGNPGSFARGGYRLWVASWNRQAPLVPADDWSGRSWRVWQYTSRGKVSGISGNVDLDWLRNGWSGATLGRTPDSKLARSRSIS